MTQNPRFDKWQQSTELIAKTNSSIISAKRFKALIFARLLTSNILVFILHYIGLMLSTFGRPFILLNLATGTSCAFVFLRGYSILPGIGLASFMAYFLYTHSITQSVIAAFVYIGQAYLLGYLCLRFITQALLFYRRAVFCQFLLVACIISCIGSYFLTMGNLTQWVNVSLANILGILIIAFAMCGLDAYFPASNQLKRMPKSKLIIYFSALLTCLSCLLFLSQLWFLFIVILILTMVIAWRYKWIGAIAACFLTGITLSLGLYLSAPLFSELSLFLLLFLQGFLILMTMVSLFIAI